MNQLSKWYQPLRIIIPVYNEGGNFASLYDQLAMIRTPFEAFVIYDFDGDNTIPAVTESSIAAIVISTCIETTCIPAPPAPSSPDSASPLQGLCWWLWPTSPTIWRKSIVWCSSIGMATIW